MPGRKPTKPARPSQNLSRGAISFGAALLVAASFFWFVSAYFFGAPEENLHVIVRLPQITPPHVIPSAQVLKPVLVTPSNTVSHNVPVTADASAPVPQKASTPAPVTPVFATIPEHNIPVATVPPFIQVPPQVPIAEPAVQEVPIARTPPVPTKSGPRASVGISVGATLYGLSNTALDARLDDLVSLGITWLRFDIDWSGVQHTSSTRFDWADTDRIVAHARARNLDLLPVLAFTPAWARVVDCNSDKCHPDSSSSFATFAAAAATRYGGQGVHAWEIWNEPNISQFWLPRPDAGDYVVLLKAAYQSIKNVDPAATIVTGSLASTATEGSAISQLDFLEELYAAGAAGNFDAVGYHPYSFPVLPSQYQSWNAWSKMSETSRNFRSIMSANGDAYKKIWITEYGAPTDGPGIIATVDGFNAGTHPDHVTEDLQARMVTNSVNTLTSYSWAGPLFWYTYKDSGTDPADAENFYGLLRRDGSKKPAYDALRQALIQS